MTNATRGDRKMWIAERAGSKCVVVITDGSLLNAPVTASEMVFSIFPKGRTNPRWVSYTLNGRAGLLAWMDAVAITNIDTAAPIMSLIEKVVAAMLEYPYTFEGMAHLTTLTQFLTGPASTHFEHGISRKIANFQKEQETKLLHAKRKLEQWQKEEERLRISNERFDQLEILLKQKINDLMQLGTVASFRDYAILDCYKDICYRMTLEKLEEFSTPEDVDAARKQSPIDRVQKNILAWRLRGLPMHMALEKGRVDHIVDSRESMLRKQRKLSAEVAPQIVSQIADATVDNIWRT